MSITQFTSIDRIEVVYGWNVQVRAIKEDGGFHRWVLTPDMDISGQEQKVQDIANAAWTPEVKAAYEQFKAEQARSLP